MVLLEKARSHAFRLQSHGSVGALVYHKEYDGVIIVRQFRPAVSLSYALLHDHWSTQREVLALESSSCIIVLRA